MLQSFYINKIRITSFVFLIFLDPYDLGRKSSEACVYEFTSDKNDNGVIMSPTYPGTYPNNLNCVYKFIGKIDERISIHFDEILIHYGADQ